MTQRQAERLIEIGDTVYTICGNRLVETRVKKLHADCLDTDCDTFFYDEVGLFWFLTKKVAIEKMQKIGVVKT